MPTAKLILDDTTVELPVIVGTEGERAIDIRKLRTQTGYITYDLGLANTGSCQSSITFINGEAGVLRYRGYAIEDLVEHSSFVEVSYLLIYGELPTRAQLEQFQDRLTHHSLLHEDMKKFFEGYPPSAHP